MSTADERDPQQPGEPVTHHVYDDIVEHDNKLPLWWQLTLYGAVLFGLVYWFGRRYDAIQSPVQAYQSDVAAQRAADAERARARGTVDDAMLSTLAKDPRTLATGKEVFITTCAPCHKPDARRQHRSEPDRRVLDPRQQADRHLQDGQRGRARQGHADVDARARRGSRRGGGGVRHLDREHERAGRQGPAGRAGGEVIVASVRLPMVEPPRLDPLASSRPSSSRRRSRRTATVTRSSPPTCTAGSTGRARSSSSRSSSSGRRCRG